MRRFFRAVLATASVSALAAGGAAADDIYVAVSGGASFLQNSDNDGRFIGDFETGAGTNVPAGTVLPDGTSVGWTTEFDTGYTVSAAVGGRVAKNVRAEIEVAYQRNGVKTHNGVTVADSIGLDGEDAGVLITGAPNLGVTVGDLVADGQGKVRNIFFMANGYYDFRIGDRVKPYIGAGVGISAVNVAYEPSGVTIIDDNDVAFAYQGMVGLAVETVKNLDVFAGYRYRGTTDVKVRAELFDAEFDVKNRGSIVEGGVRYSF